MKVPLIKLEIEDLSKKLQSYESPLQLYKWHCFEHFQSNWDISDLNLFETFQRSFSSKISNRLWVDDHFYPVKMMLEFIQLDKEFVRSMFHDLYDETKDLMMRISRFLFHCDMMLEEIHRKKPKINAHYHQDYKMISIYLSFKYPDKYTIYDYEMYAKFMKKVGALNNPRQNDLPRFFNIMKSMLNNFIIKNENLISIFEAKMLENKLRPNLNLLLAHELYSHSIE